MIVNGDGPFTYQWKKGITNLVNATNATYTIANTATNDAGIYGVTVTGMFGTTNANATLSVVPPPLNLSIFTSQGLGGFEVTLQMTGIPNYFYILQTTTNLATPIDWQPLSTNSAGASGYWSLTITNTPGFPSYFYRIIEE